MIRSSTPIPARPRTSRIMLPDDLAQQLIGRSYLSYSAVSSYQRCPLQFYFRYVVGLEPQFKSSSLVFGGAVHAAIEVYFRRLFEGADAPSHDELLAVYDEAWKAESNIPIRYGKCEDAESLRDLAARMLATFQASDLATADGELLGVEEELRAPIIDDCPDILGRIDLIAVTPKTLRVTDFKTSRGPWGDSKIWENTPQQLLYSELIQPLAEACDRPVEIRWVVLTKTKEPAIHCHTLVPDPREVARTKAVVCSVWRAIVAGSFYPSPSAMNCSTCPFQKACQTWEG